MRVAVDLRVAVRTLLPTAADDAVLFITTFYLASKLYKAID